jgi:7-cyano-7-deazaguanine reductase
MSDRDTLEHPLEQARSRRQGLGVIDNPRQGLDYLVSLEATMPTGPGDLSIAIRLRYVPDIYLLPTDIFSRYLTNLDGKAWDSIEAMGTDMLGDLDSELLPRWLQVRISSGAEHRVTLEQKQPNWENRLMLYRIPIDG